MCNQWELKMMACGHVTGDMAVERCPLWEPDKEDACPVFFHRMPEVRPWQIGDGACDECEAREFMSAQWARAIGFGVSLDPTAHAAFLCAGRYLRSLTNVRWSDQKLVQYLLISEYIEEGTVLDVAGALRGWGYYIPEVSVTTPDLADASKELGLGVLRPASSAVGDEGLFNPLGSAELAENHEVDPLGLGILEEATEWKSTIRSMSADGVGEPQDETQILEAKGVELPVPESFFPDLD
ncbi:uncharacterized protein F4822DRAFT_430642 [Hypoxylon trugodes]|uniref:uncharacterized protein n=1 Tax=Hypoxylon trugodes TaxID=326681 RepID=UPI00219A6421|nr:uncharacterized protein F4822DRAFT_430642 [Hypoxylon trugodes]KAI1387892.1 hypothetical protein F4822DRAFT_430642 [Hypoxylon trugodes]